MDSRTRRPAGAGMPIGLPAASAPSGEAAGEPAAETAPALEIPIPPDIPTPPEAPGLTDVGSEVFAMMAESQTAMTRGLEATSTEIAALARVGIDLAARTATGLTEARTWSDAIALGAESTRAGFDALVGGSLKFSEIGIRLAFDSAQPISSRLGKV